MSKRRKILMALIAMCLIFGASVTAYAAVNSTVWQKCGNQYAVDTITEEKTVDGVVVQTIERKWIPENRFNSNDPRNPLPSGDPVPVPPQPGNKVQQLRQAGIDSRNDLQTYGWSYQWVTTAVESSANDSEVRTDLTFQAEESASADRWVCTFTQVVKFDSGGKPYVRYYMGNQEYSVSSIKKMFAKYGKAR